MKGLLTVDYQQFFKIIQNHKTVKIAVLPFAKTIIKNNSEFSALIGLSVMPILIFSAILSCDGVAGGTIMYVAGKEIYIYKSFIP